MPQRDSRGTSVSRRYLLRAAPLALAVPTFALLRPDSAAAEKLSKEQANYQPSPNDGKRCSECTFFVEGGSCQQVAGEISPDGWCRLWTAE